MAAVAWEPNWEALVPRASASAGQQIAAQGGTAGPPETGASQEAFVPIDFRSPADRGVNAGGATASVVQNQAEVLQTAGQELALRGELLTPTRREASGRSVALADGESPEVPTDVGLTGSAAMFYKMTSQGMPASSAARLAGKASAPPSQRGVSIAASAGEVVEPIRREVGAQLAASAGQLSGKRPAEAQVRAPPKAARTEETVPELVARYEAEEGALAQKEMAVVTAAAKLVVVLPWESATVARLDATKPLSAERRKAALVRALSAKGESRLNSLRTTLEKARVYVTEQHGADAPVFPLSLSFLEVLKVHFEETVGCATAAKQLGDNVALLFELGFDVPSDEETLTALRRPTKQAPAPPNGGSARNELGPKLSIDYERASITGRAFEDSGEGTKLLPCGEFTPFHVYAFTRWVKIVGCCRGDDVACAKYAADPELAAAGVIRFVTEIDKSKRIDVEHLFYVGGIEVAEHPWAHAIAAKLEGRPLLPGFSFVAGQSKNPVVSTGWLGPQNDCSKNPCNTAPLANLNTTKAALAKVGENIAGMPVAELKANKNTGNHMERHDAPYVVAPLDWPPADQNALGDWSNKEVDATGKAVPHSRASRQRKGSTFNGSTQVKYRPRAEREVVIRARVRYQRAIRAFVAHFGGYDKMTYETTWADVIPAQPPTDELAEFYGEAKPDSFDATLAKRLTKKAGGGGPVLMIKG